MVRMWVDASNFELSLLFEALTEDPLPGRLTTVVSEPVDVRELADLDKGSDSAASDMKECISSGSDRQLKRLRRKLWNHRSVVAIIRKRNGAIPLIVPK
jgi:hypothetical protein